MLKELSFPGIFSAPKAKVRVGGLQKTNKLGKVLAISLGVLNAVLLLSYILGVNNYASTGYEIEALEQKITQTKEDNKKLSVEISERTSVSSMQTELSQSGFSVVKNAKFLQGQAQFSKR